MNIRIAKPVAWLNMAPGIEPSLKIALYNPPTLRQRFAAWMFGWTIDDAAE